MSNEKTLETLIAKFGNLPTVGHKSATKITYKILGGDKQQAIELLQTLQQAINNVKHCRVCNGLTEHDICHICRKPSRLEKKTVMVVGDCLDINSIEKIGVYEGAYFVLNGLLNPLDGIYSQTSGIPKLINFIKFYQIEEVILALNTSTEGEVTSNFIGEICKKMNVKCTRFAMGIPSGSNFQNLDSNTMFHAFLNRTKLD